MKNKHISRWVVLLERTSSMLDEIGSKIVHNDRESDQQRKKTLSEIKLVENISNLQSFLEITLVQKKVLLSHKLQDHVYEWENLFRLKKDNVSLRNWQNQWSHPSLCHIEQECQGSLIQDITQSNKLKSMPWIFVKLSFRELCDSNLYGLHPFDNMALIHRVKKNRSKTEGKVWVHETQILEVIFMTVTENASFVTNYTQEPDKYPHHRK